MSKTEKGEWGGAREGSGAPKKDPYLKKRQVGLTLPDWLIKKLDSLPKSRAKEIEAALCLAHGWRRPVVVKPRRSRSENPDGADLKTQTEQI